MTGHRAAANPSDRGSSGAIDEDPAAPVGGIAGSGDGSSRGTTGESRFRECARCVNYERVRRLIEQEDSLINYRLTWLFVGEGFTFAAFGVLINASVGVSAQGAHAKSTLLLPAWAARLVWGLGIGGAGAALATLCGLVGAFNAMNQAHQRWWAMTEGDHTTGAHTCGHQNWFERLQGRRKSLTLGGIPAFAFPILLTAVWVGLLLETTPWGQRPVWHVLLIAGVLLFVSFVATTTMALQATKLGELARLGCTHHGWLHPLTARRALDEHRRARRGTATRHAQTVLDPDRPPFDYGKTACLGWHDCTAPDATAASD